jgi:3'-5' exoribonuclease
MSEKIRMQVCELNNKQDVESTFLVKYLAVMEGKDKKKYLNIVLTDSTGDLETRSWERAEEIAKEINVGNFVKVEGKVNIYQGRKQLILKSINKISEQEVKMEDFVAKSEFDEEIMFTDLLKIVGNLSDHYIKQLLMNILNDPEISRRLKTWQAGKTIHHAYQSGLLEHILSCTQLAVNLSPHYKVNVNYVVAGCILHDLCKIYELTDGVNVEYTEEGKLVGHLVKGVELVDRFAYRIDNFPHQLKLHLKHILLSHHGEYAYGSPKIPQTSEAMLVHLIDLMDSKMASFETVKKNDQSPGHWSGFVKHLDRIIFKDELPFFPEAISKEAPVAPQAEKVEKPKASQLEPKTNLGKMLADLKIEK